jgi:hypothetical protein
VRAVAEVRVGEGQAGELADPQPGVDGGEQERAVAPAVPGAAVRGVASCPARHGQHRSSRRMRTGVRGHDPQMLVAGVAVAAWPSRGSA